MADPTDDDQDLEPDAPRNLRAKLEAANKRASEAEARASEVEGLQRKLLVHEAGLGSLSEKQVKALYAAHEGDATADALKSTAADLGFGTAATPADTAQPHVAEELHQLDQLGREASRPGAPLSGLDAFNKKAAEWTGSRADLDRYIAENLRLLSSAPPS